MKPKYSLENYNCGHFFEEFQDEDSFYCNKFFGGLSIYIFGKMVAFLSERPGQREWRHKKYSWDIWDGCLIPTVYHSQPQLLKKLKGSSVHPVIEKWIYLPRSLSSFENSMQKLVSLIGQKSNLVGVVPEIKLRKKTKTKYFTKKATISSDKIKISKMMNLGPVVERDFNAVGVYYANQIIRLGPEKAFIKMLEGRLKLNRSARCCNALYLYSIYGAINNIHWTKIPESKKKKFKIYTERLRSSGRFEKSK